MERRISNVISVKKTLEFHVKSVHLKEKKSSIAINVIIPVYAKKVCDCIAVLILEKNHTNVLNVKNRFLPPPASNGINDTTAMSDLFNANFVIRHLKPTEISKFIK